MIKNSPLNIRNIDFIELSKNISSRVIRSFVRENKNFRGYVDNRVHAYIKKVKLYKWLLILIFNFYLPQSY